MSKADGTPVTPCCKLVDGYNVIRRLPSLSAAERRGLAEGRAALLNWLVPRFRHTPHRLVVVFDGDGAAETAQPLRCGSGSQVVFTRRGETADQVILRGVANERAAGHVVEVITDDVAVQLASADQGAVGVGTHQLRDALADGPRHLHKRKQHHDFILAGLTRDENDAPSGRHTRKGNSRKAPRRTRG
jgi:uncharacterized protein